MRRLTAILLLLLSFFLTSCTISPPTIQDQSLSEIDVLVDACKGQNALELIHTITDEAALDSYCNENSNFESITALYPAECIRKRGENYLVLYRTTNGWLRLTFDSSQQYIGKEILRVSTATSKSLSKIEIGMSVEVVQEIDPEGNYSFMYASWSGFPAISYHYTTDGYQFFVHYNDFWQVDKITSELL